MRLARTSWDERHLGTSWSLGEPIFSSSSSRRGWEWKQVVQKAVLLRLEIRGRRLSEVGPESVWCCRHGVSLSRRRKRDSRFEDRYNEI